MKQIIIILTLFIWIGCGQNETKKIVTTYKNGKPEIVKYFQDKNDTLTYRKEVFYESGKQDYIGQVVKGTKEGVWTWWFENGNKKDQCKYLNGKEIDTIFHWYENGQLKRLDILRQGKVSEGNSCTICCNTTTIRYYENGKLQETFTKVDDMFQGINASYGADGSSRIVTYKNDSLWGPSTEHLIDSNKVIIVVGQYENGKETGLWKWFDKDSILYQTAVYENGVYNGQYLKYYPSGQIKEKATLVNGEYEGELTYFDEKNKVVKIELYKNGVLKSTKK
jgi:antitoxin component YwqK of YwqJK toxin-antitoxin module